MRIVYDASVMNVCMYVYSGVCTPRVGSRQASHKNLFGLHYCVICCEVETIYVFIIYFLQIFDLS